MLTLCGTFETGVFDASAAEIAAYDPTTMNLFIVNGDAVGLDMVNIADPELPVADGSVPLGAFGDAVSSVAIRDGLVAVSVIAAPSQDPGSLVFLDTDGTFINEVEVGANPDMVTFTPDGMSILVANEGEPSDDYSVDPEGSVSIVDVSGDIEALGDDDVVFAGFGAYTLDNIDPAVRVYGPGSTVAQDLEPEYIAVSADSKAAYVTLQENNALAVVDIAAGEVTEVTGFGFKDHSLEGNGLDASDDDGEINIANWPVWGQYQPDAIAAFEVEGETYLITANEGDARGYDALDEEERIKNLTLDPEAFPDADALQADEALGRLTATTMFGDIDNDGDHDELYVFGGRSVSVWDGAGALVYDSGDHLEQLTAEAYPDDFNCNNNENGSFDGRSDNKGPEPEGVTVAELWGRPYAFVGLERVGGVVVYDLSDPAAPEYVLYVNNRDFAGDAEAGAAGDLGPEGLLVISADDSPTGEPLLVVSNEISGTTSIYKITYE